jgi:predicted kinase
MTTLWITRGLPASGKTTWARQHLLSRPLGQIIRLNRDDLRRMGLPDGYSEPVRDAEKMITILRDTALEALLRDGRDVIVDDTNLRSRYVRDLMLIAESAGAKVEIVLFTDVSLEECIRRDAVRTGAAKVGEEVIRGMHTRYIGRPLSTPTLERPVTPEPYVPISGAPRAVLVDLDGTVALLDRGPYDESCVSTDRPNAPVITAVRALVRCGHTPVFMSGRTEGCRRETESWLSHHVLGPDSNLGVQEIRLHMRSVGDVRPDHVVKLELFNAHVRHRYDVRLVLDDRDQVVRLWRSLGLTCLQVAEGNF